MARTLVLTVLLAASFLFAFLTGVSSAKQSSARNPGQLASARSEMQAHLTLFLLALSIFVVVIVAGRA